jgi:putative flippase GtrA
MPASTPAAGSSRPGLRDRVHESMGVLAREIAKFGIIGAMSFVIDVGLFNLLLYFGPLQGKPLTAKVVSVAVATTFAYFGNRYWTFRHRGRTNMGREYVLFFLLNGVAMLIAVGCLWVSHYLMGLDSALADNISANVVGLILGTLFRFWSYRKWVFPAVPDDTADQDLADRDAITPI